MVVYIAKPKVQKVSIVASIVLISSFTPYFLFQSGFVYEITSNEIWSISLSKYRMNALQLHGSLGYVDERDVFSSRWLSTNVNISHKELYADYYSEGILTAYGVIYMGYINFIISNFTEIKPNSVVFLNKLNIINQIIVGYKPFNISELIFYPEQMSIIYSNGCSEISLKYTN